MCCVVIPVYKAVLSAHETVSLRQCCGILGKYPIVFVTHPALDCAVYKTICAEYDARCHFEFFDQRYFVNISGYNALLFSKRFYLRFKNYAYILINHLDAYVFRDELEYWCGRGYDYIGSPWLELDQSKTKPVFYAPPAVGNGGFSLRSVSRFIARCGTRTEAMSFVHFFQSAYHHISRKSRTNKWYFIPKLCMRISLELLYRLFFDKTKSNNNEDRFWSAVFHRNGNMPLPAEAARFAFENYPEHLFRLTGGELPFGCHDWFKYYNFLFFRKYIQAGEAGFVDS